MQRSLSPRQESLFVPTPAVPDTAKRRLLLALEPLLDFTAARQAAAPFFAATGRPAIPVERMLKAMLVGCLFGIPSDRPLADECADSRALSEFLGLHADEAMFSHASFTPWRQRLGPEYFRRFLHDIVRQCQAHGRSLGQARTVDASTPSVLTQPSGPRCTQVPRCGHTSTPLTSASCQTTGTVAGSQGERQIRERAGHLPPSLPQSPAPSARQPRPTIWDCGKLSGRPGVDKEWLPSQQRREHIHAIQRARPTRTVAGLWGRLLTHAPFTPLPGPKGQRHHETNTPPRFTGPGCPASQNQRISTKRRRPPRVQSGVSSDP